MSSPAELPDGGARGGGPPVRGVGTHGAERIAVEPPGTLRTLNRPRRARVRMGHGEAGAAPLAIDGALVELVRETWLVEDGWWTLRPLRRRYWEVLTANGRSIVVFHDLCSGHWFTQAG